MSESFWIHMNRATVRELRTAFPKIEAMLLNGQEVAIAQRGKIVALLVQSAKHQAKRNCLLVGNAKLRLIRHPPAEVGGQRWPQTPAATVS